MFVSCAHAHRYNTIETSLVAKSTFVQLNIDVVIVKLQYCEYMLLRSLQFFTAQIAVLWADLHFKNIFKVNYMKNILLLDATAFINLVNLQTK